MNILHWDDRVVDILVLVSQNNDTEWQCNLISLSSLDMIMDEEMLLLLRELNKREGFTAMLQNLVLYNICMSYCSLARPEDLQITEFASLLSMGVSMCWEQNISIMKWKDFSQIFLMCTAILGQSDQTGWINRYRLLGLYSYKTLVSEGWRLLNLLAND